MAKSTASAKKSKPSPEYKVIVSVPSPSLSYTAKRLGDLVSEDMTLGWKPHGSPMLAIDEDKYVLSQAVIKE